MLIGPLKAEFKIMSAISSGVSFMPLMIHAQMTAFVPALQNWQARYSFIDELFLDIFIITFVFSVATENMSLK